MTKSCEPAKALPPNNTSAMSPLRIYSPTKTLEFYSPTGIPSIGESGLHEDLAGARRRVAELGVPIAEEDERADADLGGVPHRPRDLREQHGGELLVVRDHVAVVADLRDLEGAEEAQQESVVKQLDVEARHQVGADARFLPRQAAD